MFSLLKQRQLWLVLAKHDLMTRLRIPRSNCRYSILRHDRNRNGGGVCINYLRSDLAFNPRQDLQPDGVESVWAEVLLPKTRPILTGICYRPPRQCDFYELLELSFNEGNDFSECILLGDFNTNVLVPSNNNNLCLLMLFVILIVYLVLSNWSQNQPECVIIVNLLLILS